MAERSASPWFGKCLGAAGLALSERDRVVMTEAWRGLDRPMTEDHLILIVVAMLTSVTVVLSLASLGLPIPLQALV